MSAELSEAEVVDLLRSCSNHGRWGEDDELGTLNYVTPEVRIHAAQLVRLGRVVALGKRIDQVQSAVNPRPAWHQMHHESARPYAAADSLHLLVHGLATTHLDAVAHMFFEGRSYNGRRQDEIVTGDGLAFGDIEAQAGGIFNRGVLLDVAAALGLPWLPPSRAVTPALLERAEAQAGVRVGSGDTLVVHVGLEAREAAEGPEDPGRRAGLDAACVRWLHEREVAVYTGDCIEQLPQPHPRVELPLHQIGLAAMGLVLLDCPTLVELVGTCRELGRHEFLFTASPLRVPGGTGSPVNPLAVF